MTRDQIHNLDDVWPVVRAELGHAINELEVRIVRFFREELGGIDTDLEDKFRRGEQEHKRAWLALTEADFAEAIREELLDAINYAAMSRVIRKADQEVES